ncbi:MAG: Maf family protein [Bacillota bacterium]
MILLASASPRRQQLLEQLGLDFRVIVSDVEEHSNGGRPLDIVQQLALAKAVSVADGLTDGLVIGADTIVVLGERVLGKPSSPAEAATMLRLLSGCTHQVVTGVAVVDAATSRTLVDAETTSVFFRNLSEDEIEGYVASGEPLDKAGAYGIQGLGALLVKEIHGCYYNVVGLPLVRLAEMLKYFGVRVL